MNPNEANGFDKELRNKFEGFRPEVPTGLWDKIATQLDAEEDSPTVPLAARPRRFPTWWMAVAAMLLVVCGVIYWQNRPITVTYLQAGAVTDEEKPANEPIVEAATETEPVPAVEPLDLDRLKRVFARKRQSSATDNRLQQAGNVEQQREQPLEIREPRQLAVNKIPVETTVTAIDHSESVEQQLADVPDIQPPVPQEEEEEVLLATAEQARQPFGVSNILNYVVGTVDQRTEKLVTFSNDDEGSLRLDFNFGLAKNKKKKLK